MNGTCARPGHAANYLVRAAVTAPSLHNTQPWRFASRGDDEITLYADSARRLPLADPDGREMVISCGAALFNLRLAMRHLGFLPVVRPYPQPGVPALLARIRWGPYARATDEEELMYRAMAQRHTHRGLFQATPLPLQLIDGLGRNARREGGELFMPRGSAERLWLGTLVQEAETCQRDDPRHAAELARWAAAPGTRRLDGVPVEARAFPPDCAPYAGRDFTGSAPSDGRSGIRATTWPDSAGLVAVLTTPRDTRQDWLRAGQSLQSVLLFAAAHKVSAAFHTQPLELPAYRDSIRRSMVPGQYPQVIMRLGHTVHAVGAARRPVADVLSVADAA
ncbi:nitroreductase [Streptomyces spiroverticillatus]|uniref:Nitroreductase n=1 Tax=Streptomyces finlayi TaxID=67296 RepID=A0A919C9X8_9ACTN|nr:hypothetical protein [Streptomyces finlayi]GHA08905.1 nitroreductase [Streptomyces spiroverticillatus]GHC91743.1 nitroreductase [Streptomyces finlayi]